MYVESVTPQATPKAWTSIVHDWSESLNDLKSIIFSHAELRP